MDHQPGIDVLKQRWHGTLTSYLQGLVLSIVLTITSYLVVGLKLLRGKTLFYTIIILAVIQAVAQLLFFLHLGKETKPRWNIMTFVMMALVLVILIFGSLWIMYNLNERVMSDMHASSEMGGH